MVFTVKIKAKTYVWLKKINKIKRFLQFCDNLKMNEYPDEREK